MFTTLVLAGVLSICTALGEARTNGSSAVVSEARSLPANSTCDVNGTSFLCSPLECVGLDLTCDGVPHCSNGADEAVTLCGCLSNEFSCGNSCIDILKRCDTKDDCPDGRDEQNCELYSCPHTHVTCANHKCVPHDVICDFVDDCGDGTDELQCTPRKCWKSEFTCANGQCVRPANVCDGGADCHDGSDEANCTDGDFALCGNGAKVHRYFWCDGWPDCADNHADEINCGPCAPDQFRCSGGRCVQQSAVCNGVCDCAESCADEKTCDRRYTVTHGVVQCVDNRTWPCYSPRQDMPMTCIGSEFICDGQVDCLTDGVVHMSDEQSCRAPGDAAACDSGDFRCGDGRCVPRTALCDHKPDCLDGADEARCAAPACAPHQWRCSSGQCVPASARCDLRFDCYDRSDETQCETIACPAHLRRCSSGQCLAAHKWCNHVTDCWDHSDETACAAPSKCGVGEFRCASGQCVPLRDRCFQSGLPGRGCGDGSHLVDCDRWKCPSTEFKCTNGPCLNMSLVCNNRIDCAESWNDEDPCTFQCSEDARCQCRDVTINCTGLARIAPPEHIESQITIFDFRDNRIDLQKSFQLFLRYERAVKLYLSSNGIRRIPPMVFRNMFRLHVLDLRNNEITAIENHTFFGLQNVKAIYLEGNRIQTVQDSSFLGLSSLNMLDLSGQMLDYLPSRSFIGLRRLVNLNLSNNGLRKLEVATFTGLNQLLVLDISDNQIEGPPRDVFRSLVSLHHLETDMFGLCCLARHADTCLPMADEFSSCEDLMSNIVLRSCIWVLGTVALSGNLVVMCWRVCHKTSNKVHSFLIVNLAFSDCLMGVYLLMIAVVDQYYRGRYSVHEQDWRSSSLCNLAGFVSTFSSELSVFTLTVITLDRFLVIIFPFHLDRLEMSRTRAIMLVGWTGVTLLAATPFLPLDYFSGFYGRSGVCLALHITPDYPPGWQYSVFVFLILNLFSFGVIALGYACMFVAAKRTQAAVPALRRRSQRHTRQDGAMARRMSIIVATDAACWLPIITLGIVSLCGVSVPPQVYAWVAVFVLPLNAAVNPLLYTLSTVQFVEQVEKRIHTFRQSWKRSFTIKTCTTGIGDDKGNDTEAPTWSQRVCKYPVEDGPQDMMSLVDFTQQGQRSRVQASCSLPLRTEGRPCKAGPGSWRQHSRRSRGHRHATSEMYD